MRRQLSSSFSISSLASSPTHLERLTNRNGFQDLQSRLKALPPNLKDLYATIPEHLDENRLSLASRLLQIVKVCDDSYTLLRAALADLENVERAMQAPARPTSDREMSALCKNMKRKLTSRWSGLLAISSPINHESMTIPMGTVGMKAVPLMDRRRQASQQTRKFIVHRLAKMTMKYAVPL